MDRDSSDENRSLTAQTTISRNQAEKKILNKISFFYARGRMTQMEAKSHGESYLGRRTESYQVVASHAGLCFRTSMNQYSACFPFQPFLDKRLYMAVH